MQSRLSGLLSLSVDKDPDEAHPVLLNTLVAEDCIDGLR